MPSYSSTTVLIPMATVGRTPELRMLGANGTPKCDLWVAVDRWNAGEKHTEWFNVTAWRRLAEIVAEHVDKGSKVSITGHLRSDVYEAKDGSKRRSLQIVADEVRFLSRPRAAGSRESTEAHPAQSRRAAA